MSGTGPPILKQVELIAGETEQHQWLSQLLRIINASFIRSNASPKAQIYVIGIHGKHWQPGSVNGLGKGLGVTQDLVPCLPYS